MELSLGHADQDFAGTRRLRVGQGLQLENLGRLAEPGGNDSFHDFALGGNGVERT
jgi:hypothetical protein